MYQKLFKIISNLYFTKKCDPGVPSSFGVHKIRTVSKLLLLAIWSYVNSGLSNWVPSGNGGLVFCSIKNLLQGKITDKKIS